MEKKKFDGLFPLMFPGYKIVKPIFWVWLLASAVVGAWVLYDNNAFVPGGLEKNIIYLACPEDARTFCENPFYRAYPCPSNDPRICSQKIILPGTSIGEKPGVIASNFGFIILGGFVVAFLINHFLYNRSYKFKEGAGL